jgi:DNA polymerase kappa
MLAVSAHAPAFTQVFKLYDPQFEAMSLDEAYLDVTPLVSSSSGGGGGGSGSGGGGSSSSSPVTPLSIADEIRERVHVATGLTCSVGAAANKLIAKICRFASTAASTQTQALLCPLLRVPCM